MNNNGISFVIFFISNYYEPQHYENYRFLTWFKNNISRTNEEITNLNILWNTAKYCDSHKRNIITSCITIHHGS
jgi:hypothetical protein